MHCFYKPFIFLFLLFSAGSGITQDSLEISSTVDRNRILIGEPITLTLSVKIPSQEPIRFFQIDSIPHFEILDRGKIDTSDNRNAVEMSQELKLTSFDSGSWVIPSFIIAGSELRTDSFPMEVSYTPGFDPKQEYRDIKDILTIPPAKEKPWYQRYAWVAGILLLLLFVGIWLGRRKKPEKVLPTAPEKDPYQVAMEQLAALRPGTMDRKLFHSRVVEIFRVFLKKAKGIESLQQTTDDLVRQLRQLNLSEENFTKLSEALQTTDLVKFAKYETEEAEDIFVHNTIKRSIELIGAAGANGTTQNTV